MKIKAIQEIHKSSLSIQKTLPLSLNFNYSFLKFLLGKLCFVFFFRSLGTRYPLMGVTSALHYGANESGFANCIGNE